MKKKRKKLRLTTVLMLGATVFLPTKKALGILDDVGNTAEDAKRLGTVIYKISTTKEVLAGETFVNSSLDSPAATVVRYLRGATVKEDALVKSLNDLYKFGTIGKVMAHESTFKPDLSDEELKDLITQGLKKIVFTKEDPFEELVEEQIYTGLGLKDIKEKIIPVIGNRVAIEELFATNLPLVMKEIPGILNSFLAKLPESPKEMEAQILCNNNFARYFTARGVNWKPTLAYKETEYRTNPGKENEKKLKEAAIVYYTLLQKEKALNRPKPSTESRTVSGPSSSSSSSSGPAAPSSSMTHTQLEEAAPQPSSSSSIHSAPTTFRTAGANPSARIKHSAVAIQLPNQDLLGDAYELVVNHRTRGEGPMVRIYDPKTKVYDNLGILPISSSFSDTTFDITDWAKTARDTSSLGTQVATYLSFLNGKSDVHSFKIQSRGRVLKEIVFGDAASESQAGIHVYGPEKSGDANEWSTMQSEDLLE